MTTPVRQPFALLVLLLLLATSSAEAGSSWEVIKQEDGITVTQKEVLGRDMPVFRGETLFKANIYQLLAILQDFNRHSEWMHSCQEARLLKKHSDFHLVSYYHTKTPWPADPRDVVLETRVQLLPEKHTVMIRYKGITTALKPPVEDIVRMPRLKGYFKLVARSPTETFMQYQVDADPGGSLPSWIAVMASEDIPFNTLVNVRAQVKASKGRYKAFVDQWNPAINPEAPRLVPD